MKCPICHVEIRYTGAPHTLQCTSCDVPLIPDITDIFKHHAFGLIKETRPAQIEYVTEVDNFLDDPNTWLLTIEGGTGVGKSYGYAIPAILRNSVPPPNQATSEEGLDNSHKTLIVTSKKTLQNQLENKDLPAIHTTLNIPYPYGSVKGASNYLCLRSRGTFDTLYAQTKYDKIATQAISSHKYVDTDTWSSTEPTTCYWNPAASTEHCTRSNKCGYYCRPKLTHYVTAVTNHYYLALLLKYNAQTLYPFKRIIIDEAHKLYDALLGTDTVEYHKKTTSTVLNLFKHEKTLAYLASIWYGGIYDWNKNEYVPAISSNIHTQTVAALNITAQALLNNTTPEAFGLLAARLSDLTAAITLPTKDKQESKNSEQKEDSTERKNAKRIKAHLHRLADYCSFISTYYKLLVYKQNPYQPEVTYTPLKLCTPYFNIIQNTLPETKVILTSATLSVDNNFEHLHKSLQLDSVPATAQKSKVIRSTTNYQKQAVLYTPPQVPLFDYTSGPRRDAWLDSVSSIIVQTAQWLKKCIMVLCVSRADEADLHAKIEEPLTHLGMCVIRQGNNVVSALEAYDSAYKNNKNPIIIGTKSLWEGVDKPGEQLIGLILTRLPLVNMTDPRHKAIQELEQITNTYEYYNTRIVPDMIMEVKQGIGRLLRGPNDRGLIVCTDSRILTGTSQAEKHAQKIATLIKTTNEETRQKLIFPPNTRSKNMHYGSRLLVDLNMYPVLESAKIPNWVSNNIINYFKK
jgi:ATP-dependent DNA helicase DinG